MKPSQWIALAIVLLTMGWLASGVLGQGSEPEPPPPPPAEQAARHDAEARVPDVRVTQSLAKERVRRLRLLGRTAASRHITLKAETEGRVIALPVPKGQTVAEGADLVRLALEDREARLAEATEMEALRQLEFDVAQQLQRRDFASRVSLAEARANLEAAQARKAEIALDVARTRITAPFDGVFADNLVEIGDFVREGDALGTIVDLDPLTVTGQVSERDVADLTLDQKASVTLVDGRELEGCVTYIAPSAEAATRTFPIEISVPNPDGRVPEGMTAEIRLPLSAVRAHLVSPAVLALDAEGRIGIKHVTDDDRVAFAPVQISGDGAGGLWVTGLPETIRLITVGQAFVKTGQTVRAVTDEAIADRSRALIEQDAQKARPLGGESGQ